MSGAFSGRVALVTGASGGIGQALAHRLADEGAALALGSGASAGPAQKLAAEIAAGGERVPAGRLGRPAEVADLAVAILANPYLTNRVISLDGGIHPR